MPLTVRFSCPLSSHGHPSNPWWTPPPAQTSLFLPRLTNLLSRRLAQLQNRHRHQSLQQMLASFVVFLNFSVANIKAGKQPFYPRLKTIQGAKNSRQPDQTEWSEWACSVSLGETPPKLVAIEILRPKCSIWSFHAHCISVSPWWCSNSEKQLLLHLIKPAWNEFI